MPIENSYNFKQIHALLTSSGVVGAGRLKGLSREGYELVINLLPDNSEHAIENERRIVESQDIKYVYIPVDFGNPSLDDYLKFATVLDEAKQMKIHIHCAANYRVSAFYSLYAEARGLWNETESQEFLQTLWNPSEAQGWAEFTTAVRKYNASAKRRVT